DDITAKNRLPAEFVAAQLPTPQVPPQYPLGVRRMVPQPLSPFEQPTPLTGSVVWMWSPFSLAGVAGHGRALRGSPGSGRFWRMGAGECKQSRRGFFRPSSLRTAPPLAPPRKRGGGSCCGEGHTRLLLTKRKISPSPRAKR